MANERSGARWGLLVAYSSSDEYYASSTDLTSLQLSALGKLPVNDAMFVFGRLGVARLSLDESETFKSPQGNTYESSSESKTKALIGLGAGYNVSQALAVRAEYLRHAKVGEVTFSSLSLGATYSF
jgi:opacity protein-like surface antigen